MGEEKEGALTVMELAKLLGVGEQMIASGVLAVHNSAMGAVMSFVLDREVSASTTTTAVHVDVAQVERLKVAYIGAQLAALRLMRLLISMGTTPQQGSGLAAIAEALEIGAETTCPTVFTVPNDSGKLN